MATNDPRPIAPLTQSDTIRFWSKVRKQGDAECWLWTAGTCTRGYGKFWCARATYRAPRIAYYLATGVDPGEGLILHGCDTTGCVNPMHLRMGDLDANTADRVQRQRSAFGDRNGSRLHPERHPRGERIGNARFTSAQILEMRRLYASGLHTQRSLAKLFLTKQPNIQSIVAGNAWRHLPLNGELGKP